MRKGIHEADLDTTKLSPELDIDKHHSGKSIVSTPRKTEAWKKRALTDVNYLITLYNRGYRKLFCKNPECKIPCDNCKGKKRKECSFCKKATLHKPIRKYVREVYKRVICYECVVCGGVLRSKTAPNVYKWRA